MSPIKAVSRSIAAFCGTCIFTLVASRSDLQAQGFDTPRSFEAKVVNGEKVGWEQTRLVHLKGATNEMIFAVPDGLRVEAAENKVTLTSPEATFFLNFRLRIGALSGEQAPNEETARKRVLDQYAGAKIVDEYQVGTPERSGRGYELRWTPAGMTERLVRVAQIPTEAETIELTLVAEPSKAGGGDFAFNRILTTLRKAQNGKYEPAPAAEGS